MSEFDLEDDGPYVVIERSEPGIGTFVMGLAALWVVALMRE